MAIAHFKLSLGTRTGNPEPRTPHVVVTEVTYVALVLDECSDSALLDARLTASWWGCANCEMLLGCELIDVIDWEE